MEGVQLMGSAGYVSVSAFNEQAMKDALLKKGPLIVMMDVEDSFLNYTDGIY